MIHTDGYDMDSPFMEQFVGMYVFKELTVLISHKLPILKVKQMTCRVLFLMRPTVMQPVPTGAVNTLRVSLLFQPGP
jgi:hypothetical protein